MDKKNIYIQYNSDNDANDSGDDNNGGSSTSGSSHCTICLDACTNKCFINDCMHHFCFECLREWSKVSRMHPESERCSMAMQVNEYANDFLSFVA